MRLLTEEKVSHYMSLLNQSQRDFLQEYIKQSKKSKWLQVLAEKKGISIEGELDFKNLEAKIADWVLVDVRDGGLGKRPYRCACGQKLRFQYIVFHRGKNERLELGSTCFENYTELSPEIVKDIYAGFHSIDLERDEILLKFKNGVRSDFAIYGEMEIPELLQQQVKLGLPLSDRQTEQLHKLWERFLQEKRNLAESQRKKAIYQGLPPVQREIVNGLPDKEKDEILRKMLEGNPNDRFNYEPFTIPEKISNHLKAGLPLLDRQREQLDKLRREYSERKERELEERRREREYRRQQMIAKERKEVFRTLTGEQKSFITMLDESEQGEVLDLIKKGSGVVPMETVSKLDVAPEWKEQVRLGLPLLPQQAEVVLYEQERRRKASGGVMYEELLLRHIDTLKHVREKEERIPAGLRQDWILIQEMVKELREEKPINYSRFKVLLSNLIVPLRVKKDKYL
ncbi:MAG: hypothetical protein LRY73_07495 [Bacillus sp. (in: Bacteria)]|nr:hypothetical protein [Bacillus sp. (in: firmicutes)]